MAEDDRSDSQGEDTEPVVNRWIADYYFFQALQSFERGRYEDFCSIKLLLDQLLTRPVENTESIPIKIDVLQFLSRINECEKLDTVFELVTPLESALLVLEDMRNLCDIPQQDFKKVSTSIKEMIVGISIKSSKFDKAKEMLQKHFPKPVVSKKAIFMGLVKQKCRNHEIIEQIDFQQFKEEMVAFCQTLCSFGVPFLHKAAKQLIDKRIAEQDNQAAGPDEHAELSPSCSQKPSTAQLAPRHCSVIQRVRLEAAYTALAVGTGQKTFAELEEELENQAQDKEFCLQLSPESQGHNKMDSEWDGLFQRNSGSPMEASPADQTEQTGVVPETQAGSKTPPVLQSRKPYSMARLVVEPDSQPSSYSTAASQEMETEVRIDNPTQPLTASGSKTLQGAEQDGEAAVTTQKSVQSKGRTRKGRGSKRTSTSRTTQLSDKEGGSIDSETNREAHSRSSDSLTGLVEKSSAEGETEQEEVGASSETPKPKHQRRSTRNLLSRDTSSTDDPYISEPSLNDSPSLGEPSGLVPQKSSTPQKNSARKEKKASHSKWKSLYNNAKESKETWSDEESYFTSKTKKKQNESTLTDSGKRRKMWTERETQKLKEGVKKFGEGNWSRIKAYCSFHDRTNVNLKDRWRTMQKKNLV